MRVNSQFLATIREPLLALRPFDCYVIKCRSAMITIS